ncbi:MAG: stomatin-like protein, partial [Pseudanabaenaceae cyanobacterium bins.68]|nr:stomatin-like protein [Pseudanabaenaceae cyanobacterium bins.68]
VATFGKFNRKLAPGPNFIIPIMDTIAYRGSLKEQVLDIPPQQCITRDNVPITADAVVYWRIVDMEKAFYRVQSLQEAMVNVVLTQIRAELGNLELDETFTARNRINELLLRDLDESTDPWGVKVTRVELRDIIPAKAVMEAMELQMTAERKKRAAILSSEGEREAAINKAKGQADALLLAAEAQKKSTILKAEADQQQQILKAQGIARSAEIIAAKIAEGETGQKALEVLLAINYFDMGAEIGRGQGSKVMFMDPRTIPATLEGVRAIISDPSS